MKRHSLLYHVFHGGLRRDKSCNKRICVCNFETNKLTKLRRCELVFLQIEWFNNEKAGAT